MWDVQHDSNMRPSHHSDANDGKKANHRSHHNGIPPLALPWHLRCSEYFQGVHLNFDQWKHEISCIMTTPVNTELVSGDTGPTPPSAVSAEAGRAPKSASSLPWLISMVYHGEQQLPRFAESMWDIYTNHYESVFCRRKTGTATDSRWAAKIGAVMNPVSCRLKLWMDLQRRIVKSARILIFSTDPIMYIFMNVNVFLDAASSRSRTRDTRKAAART